MHKMSIYIMRLSFLSDLYLFFFFLRFFFFFFFWGGGRTCHRKLTKYMSQSNLQHTNTKDLFVKTKFSNFRYHSRRNISYHHLSHFSPSPKTVGIQPQSKICTNKTTFVPWSSKIGSKQKFGIFVP